MSSTLALVEVDNHNDVFAALGQASRDIFLEEFADRIGQFARQSDELIEIQPNKFCILLENVSEPVQLELAGAKLTRLFEAPIQILDEEFKASVHTAFVPPRKGDSTNLQRMQIAESALIEARNQRLPFLIRNERRAADDTDLRRPREIELAFERGEFVMYFQPLVHAGFRNVIAAEALMRWHHPEGVRHPGTFIPYLTQSAIIEDLTWFALKSSIAQAKSWPGEIGVAVNISPLLLLNSNLIQNVSDSLSVYDYPPHRLIIEITEEAMISDPTQASSALSELREIGVEVAVDDFGTGYSSLAAFRELPVDKLKVDRSFVSNVTTHPRDRDIIRAIVALAHAFDLKVVAEGVEDEQTASLLQELGVDQLQGFYLGQPMPPEKFRSLLT